MRGGAREVIGDLTSSQLVDPDWQDAARRNAAKGYPWATWGFRGGRPGVLLGAHKTQAEAELYARRERACLRPRGEYTVIVCEEKP